MPTTSTVPALKAALKTAITSQAGSVQVSRHWPGPTTEQEGIYIGDVSGSSEIDSIKTGRQRRKEQYAVTIICQTFYAGATSADADDSEDRAYALMAHVENAVAADADVGASVKWSELTRWDAETLPFERGWATRITLTLSCTSHLT